MDLSILKHTWSLLLENKLFLVLFVIFDIAFFVSLIYSQSIIYPVLGDYSAKLFSVVERESKGLNESNLSNLDSILSQNAEFIDNYRSFLKYFSYLVLSFFLIFVVFQGINWFLAHKIVRREFSIPKFALWFFLWCIMWLVSIVFIQSVIISLGSNSAFAMAVAFLAIFYFGAISFASINILKFREMFVFAVRNWEKLIKYLSFIFLGLIFLSFISYYLVSLNYLAGILFSILITIPFMAFARTLAVDLINTISASGAEKAC